MEEKAKLILTVPERFNGISTLFLVEADSETLLLQRSIREKTEIGTEESKKLELKTERIGNAISLSWEKNNEDPFYPELGVKELAYLDKRLTSLEKSKKLTEKNLDLALKIWEAVK